MKYGQSLTFKTAQVIERNLDSSRLQDAFEYGEAASQFNNSSFGKECSTVDD